MFDDAGGLTANAASPSLPVSGDDHLHSRRRRLWKATQGALIQIALMGGLFALYRYGRLLSINKVDAAFDHAEELWHIERWLHLPSEVTVQKLSLGAHWLIEFANRYYVAVHFPLTIGVLFWLYTTRREHYRWARAMIIGASVPALLIQVGVPVAPPRMLTHYGILDTMAAFGPTAYPPGRTGLSNQFAALPSLHVGWAILLAVVAWRMRHRVAQIILTLHAFITIWVVLVTGNHYWIDAFLGIALDATAALVLCHPRIAAIAHTAPTVPSSTADTSSSASPRQPLSLT